MLTIPKVDRRAGRHYCVCVHCSVPSSMKAESGKFYKIEASLKRALCYIISSKDAEYH